MCDPVSTEEQNLRDEYPETFQDVAELVGRVGGEIVRAILDQIDREAAEGCD